MWNLKVPKRVFFYWGAKRLPFLRYMTVHSFRMMNPEWEVKFYIPFNLCDYRPWDGKQIESALSGENTFDYTNYLRPKLNIKPIVFDFEELGLSNDINEVHKSDFLRYHLLETQGGVWFDMDVLFIKPMEELLCNKQGVDASVFYYYGDDVGVQGHAIGFLMSTPNGGFFSEVLKLAKNKKPTDYQEIGADLLNRDFPPYKIREMYPQATSIDKDAIYAIHELSLLYTRCDLKCIRNSIGIHWYGGCEQVKNILLNVNHRNYLNYKNSGTVMTALRQTFPNF
jgi:hypothetical protein